MKYVCVILWMCFRYLSKLKVVLNVITYPPVCTEKYSAEARRGFFVQEIWLPAINSTLLTIAQDLACFVYPSLSPFLPSLHLNATVYRENVVWGLENQPWDQLEEILSAWEESAWKLGAKRALVRHCPCLTLLWILDSYVNPWLSHCPNFILVHLTGRSLRWCFPWLFPGSSWPLKAKVNISNRALCKWTLATPMAAAVLGIPRSPLPWLSSSWYLNCLWEKLVLIYLLVSI